MYVRLLFTSQHAPLKKGVHRCHPLLPRSTMHKHIADSRLQIFYCGMSPSYIQPTCFNAVCMLQSPRSPHVSLHTLHMLPKSPCKLHASLSVMQHVEALKETTSLRHNNSVQSVESESGQLTSIVAVCLAALGEQQMRATSVSPLCLHWVN